jgi:hypothetical protein
MQIGIYRRKMGFTITGGVSLTPNPGGDSIDKFPFASDSNATNVGDLSEARGSGVGQQY